MVFRDGYREMRVEGVNGATKRERAPRTKASASAAVRE